MNAQVGRLFAILEAQTAEFDARMDASSKVVERMTRSQTVAARAAGQVRSGLQGLANQAFATAGPLGQVASGLSQITLGASALVGAAAGGALFLWFNHLSKELDKATAKSQELHVTWRRMAADRLGSPVLALMAEREPIANQRDDVQSQIESRIRRIRLFDNPDPNAPLAALLRDDAKLQQLFSQLQALNGILDEIGRKPEAALLPLRREFELLGAPLERVVEAQAKLVGLVGEGAEEFVRLNLQMSIYRTGVEAAAAIAKFDPSALADISTFVFDPKQGDSGAAKAGLESLRDVTRGIGKDDAATNIMNQLVAQEQQRLQILDLMNNKTFMANLAAQGLTDEFNAMVRSMTRVELKSQQMAVAIIGAVSGAIQAIASGGGAGSVISGAGGVLSALATKHPGLLVPGVLLGVFGGLIGLFERQHSERERNEERRKNELIGALHEGPLRSTDFYIGDPEMGRYARERDDRLGGGPSRMGV